MPPKQQRSLLPYGLLFIVFLGAVGGIQLSKRRAEQRIQSANPMSAISSLRGLPVLLLTVGIDDTIPPGRHAEPFCKALGNSCTLQEFGAIGMGYTYMFDGVRIQKFLRSNVHGNTTVFLLNGNGQTASDWTNMEHASGPADHARVDLTALLKKSYPCETVESGSKSWGNDASVAALEKQIGNRSHVVLIGERMGALTMWRWAERHRDRVAALVGIMPVCDLAAMTHGQFANQVRKAYGSL